MARRKPRASHRKQQGPRFGSTKPNQLYADAFPREMKVTMKYSTVRSFTPSAGLCLDQVYNMNSIFDPDSSGSGHQPHGRDQWSNFYGRYRVDRCDVTFKCGRSDGGTFVIFGSNNSSLITNVSDPLEAPGALIGAHTNNGSTLNLFKSFNLADLTGVTREVYNADDRYQASFGSSPTEVLACHVCWTPAALDAGLGYATIVLTQYVTMFDPIFLSES